MDSKVSNIIAKKFNTSKKGHDKYLDKENFLHTTVQGKKFCDYRKI